MEQRLIKQKKCKVCGGLFYPFKTTDVVCSEKHARELQKQKNEAKKERLDKAVKSARVLKFELAKVTFNAYIRERDKNKPCISCGNPKALKQAGHFFSGGGHAAVIFDEDNVHGQCIACNITKAGNLGEYAIRLERKIKPVGFELLRARAYEPKKWTTEELDGVIVYYKRKLKELQEKK